MAETDSDVAVPFLLHLAGHLGQPGTWSQACPGWDLLTDLMLDGYPHPPPSGHALLAALGRVMAGASHMEREALRAGHDQVAQEIRSRLLTMPWSLPQLIRRSRPLRAAGAGFGGGATATPSSASKGARASGAALFGP